MLNGQLIYDKGDKKYTVEKRPVSSICDAETIGQLHVKESNCTIFSHYTQK